MVVGSAVREAVGDGGRTVTSVFSFWRDCAFLPYRRQDRRSPSNSDKPRCDCSLLGSTTTPIAWADRGACRIFRPPCQPRAASIVEDCRTGADVGLRSRRWRVHRHSERHRIRLISGLRHPRRHRQLVSGIVDRHRHHTRVRRAGTVGPVTDAGEVQRPRPIHKECLVVDRREVTRRLLPHRHGKLHRVRPPVPIGHRDRHPRVWACRGSRPRSASSG